MTHDSSAAAPSGREVIWDARVHQVRGALPVPVPTTFGYSASDPFAVRIVFRPPHTSAVTWYVARDLLASGTRVLSGIGEARIWPSGGPGRQGVVNLRLGTPQAHALFVLDRAALAEWLDRTYALVPAGGESLAVDWDTLTGLLLPPGA